MNTQEFIKRAKEIHGNKYDYSLVEYINTVTKVKIICPFHGIFEQKPNNHIKRKHKCKKCMIGDYSKNNIPKYINYSKKLEPYGVKCRRNKEDKNILEVQCMYCNKWYIPTRTTVYHKLSCINGLSKGEKNLYCSNKCKKICPTFGQVKYPKGFKRNTSREVQPQLRKLVLERDNWTCLKCGSIENGLHCHHIEGVELNPIESADMDNCITVCKKCHNKIHSKNGCTYSDYKRKECK